MQRGMGGIQATGTRWYEGMKAAVKIRGCPRTADYVVPLDLRGT